MVEQSAIRIVMHVQYFTLIVVSNLHGVIWPLGIICRIKFVTLQLSPYGDVIMAAVASEITSLTIVYSTVYSDAGQRHNLSASLAFVRGIHRGPVNSPPKWPVTRKMFSFDDVIMCLRNDAEWNLGWLHWHWLPQSQQSVKCQWICMYNISIKC